MNKNLKEEFLESLSLRHRLEDKAKEEFIENSIFQEIPKGNFISMEGDYCEYFAFVFEGVVRVYKLGETGREITLYRLEKGESCILTASCVMNRSTFPALSIAETDLKVLLVPSQTFREWIKKYSYWADYLYLLLSERLSDVITIVEEVAFKRMDVRIAEYLLKKYQSENNSELSVTHQAIAGELGSSREVVSRLLKDFEHENIISLSRNKIEIVNPKLLIEKKSGK